MLFMTVYSWEPGKRDEVAKRSPLNEDAALPKGIKSLGQWSVIGNNRGFRLLDVEDPEAMYKGAREWTDLFNVEYFPVLETAEVLKIISSKK
jgi:hypothetical protein